MTILFILITILLFGALIAIHEFGHFIAAKTLGVRVEEFAIGMGPKLLSRTRGETTYSPWRVRRRPRTIPGPSAVSRRGKNPSFWWPEHF